MVGGWDGVQPGNSFLNQLHFTLHPMFTFSFCSSERYAGFMALVRILVDGYSLLHDWPELAPGKARHSASAREELIQRLKLER